ncbi:unnamed protein product [Protopolystoma xenopodis]|uniref:Uncharacterized protein n=1 Tax=Protopolystoma xenopodis TaxID=117903 RepID=A0A3S5AZB4_9PLAT|nr:unnamed protein product [Protopolystoma xenopodis]
MFAYCDMTFRSEGKVGWKESEMRPHRKQEEDYHLARNVVLCYPFVCLRARLGLIHIPSGNRTAVVQGIVLKCCKFAKLWDNRHFKSELDLSHSTCVFDYGRQH